MNQVIALVAAVHQTHRLPASDPASPASPACPANRPGADLVCYNVATGVNPFFQTHMDTLNRRDTKLARPFIPKKKLLDYYKPFISKIIRFDTTLSHHVLDISQYTSADNGFAAAKTSNGYDVRPANESDDGHAWTDPPINCGRLEINPIQTVIRNWGAIGGKDSPGWIGYLQCVRDAMEKGGSSRVWADYIV